MPYFYLMSSRVIILYWQSVHKLRPAYSSGVCIGKIILAEPIILPRLKDLRKLHDLPSGCNQYS